MSLHQVKAPKTHMGAFLSLKRGGGASSSFCCTPLLCGSHSARGRAGGPATEAKRARGTLE